MDQGAVGECVVETKDDEVLDKNGAIDRLCMHRDKLKIFYQ